MKTNSAPIFGCIFLVFLIVASCATLPPERPSGQWLGVLPPESTFFVAADIISSRELLESFLAEAEGESKEILNILKRTSRLYAGVKLSPFMPASLSVIALGNYPAALVRIPLGINKEWHKARAPRPYWQHSVKVLQVAVPERNLILFSTGTIERMLERLQHPLSYPLPPEVSFGMEQADFIIFFPILPTLSEKTQLEKLPFRRFWVTADKGEKFYELVGVFALADTYEIKQARLVKALFRLVLIGWMRKAKLEDIVSRLKGMEITILEENIQITGLRLSNREIINALLILLDWRGVPHE